MLSIQHLFQSMPELERALAAVDRTRDCQVQIFTADRAPQQALALAQQVQALVPQAQIIGSSANAVIYQGEQYDNATLLTVEQYEHATVRTALVPLAGKTYSDIASEIHAFWRADMPRLLRMFVGNYYDYAHQLIHAMNALMPSVHIVGGMAGEIAIDTVPFVFDATQVTEHALVFAGVVGQHLSIYDRIHTSHSTIGSAHTITGATDRAIDTIDDQPAQVWLQRNLGFLSTKQYATWEEIAANDPLVHFQIALAGHERATRFLHYEESSQAITQYFSRLDAGTKFRISYTSPTRCVEECTTTCQEVRKQPMEQLFCYSCLFRKLYLKNCAHWELSPFHKNAVSGVFLLGEFGYSNGANTLLNGSCVLSGIGETEHYMNVDMGCLDRLNEIQDDSEDLLDFILKKQRITESAENRLLLDDIISRENNRLSNMFHYLDPHLKMDNMLKYELDKSTEQYTKLCLMKIENADVLLSYLGPANYYDQLKETVNYLNVKQAQSETASALHTYSINTDTFAVAASDVITREQFLQVIEQMQQDCEDAQVLFCNTPYMLRYVVVFEQDYLLEQAYSLLELHRNTQTRLIIDDASECKITSSRNDLDNINLIQYALSQDKVVPYYQGIYNNRTKKIDCYEALMRLEDREGNILAPIQFMESSKKYRLYLDLNLKMFEAVLRDFEHVDCAVNINISAHDIASARFRYIMRQRLKAFPKPSNLTFEILEDEYFKDIEGLKEFIREVRTYGVKIAVDDFGSGYSNLLELIKICPDYLKIDGEIIRGIHTNYENEVIVDMISTLGKRLNINLIAEFVENGDIQEILEKYHILRSQGYCFAKPLPFHAIKDALPSL